MKRWLKAMEQRLRRLIYGPQPMPDDPRVRRVSHLMANEVQKLNAEVRRIQRSPDPWHELVKALRGCDHHAD